MRDIAFLPSLTRLDLSNNQIHEVEGVATGTALRWLNFSCNKITFLKPLSALVQLQVAS